MLISFDDAAGQLGIGRTLLRQLLAAGKIRYVSVGMGQKRKRIMFTAADLSEFVASTLMICFLRPRCYTSSPHITTEKRSARRRHRLTRSAVLLG